MGATPTEYWSYRVYDSATPSALFGEFAPLVELWRAKCVDDQLPAWRDFDLQEFAGWYGHISLGHVSPDMMEMALLLWGTKLAQWWDKDYTGKAMKVVSGPCNSGQIDRSYVRELLTGKGVGVCGGNLWNHQRKFVNIKSIELPLQFDGSTSRILSIYLREADFDVVPGVSPVYEFIEYA